MKLKITDYLTIELSEPNELIELMSEDDKLRFFQSLSCHDSVFTHVANQIVHGCTDDGYSASSSNTQHEPTAVLDAAKRLVAKSMDKVTRKEIERLELALKQAVESSAKWQNKYHDLYRGRLSK